MTQRINTTDATGETAIWVPGGETIIQTGAQQTSSAVVELHGRIDPNAPFAYIGSIRVASGGFIHCLKLPQLKIIWHGNRLGDQLEVWSVE